MPRASSAAAVDDNSTAIESVPLRRSTRTKRTIHYSENKKNIVIDEHNEKPPKRTDATENHIVVMGDSDKEPPKKKTRTGRTETQEVKVVVPAPGSTSETDKGKGKDKGKDNNNQTTHQKQKEPKTLPKARYANDRGETLKRPYQIEASPDFEKRKTRALSHPIAILYRERFSSANLKELFEMAGSTGERYFVTICDAPKCTCPDFTFRRQACKHIIYALHYALKVPEDSELLYQTAYSAADVERLLCEETAGPTPLFKDAYQSNKRKPIEGDCSICFMELRPEKEEIEYCRSACGKNVHGRCMQMWIQAQTTAYGKASCVYCREAWW